MCLYNTHNDNDIKFIILYLDHLLFWLIFFRFKNNKFRCYQLNKQVFRTSIEWCNVRYFMGWSPLGGGTWEKVVKQRLQRGMLTRGYGKLSSTILINPNFATINMHSTVTLSTVLCKVENSIVMYFWPHEMHSLYLNRQ